jgi:hypothetical protein
LAVLAEDVENDVDGDYVAAAVSIVVFSGRSEEGNFHYQFRFTINTNSYNTLQAIEALHASTIYFHFL